MNKRDAIELVENTSYSVPIDSPVKYLTEDTVVNIIKQLDEPEKIVVPQCVADWYEDNKHGIENEIYDLCVRFHEDDYFVGRDFKSWFDNSKNNPIQTLVAMHKYGYEVKKEKLYTARVKGLEVEYDKVYINQDKKTGELFIDDLDEIDGVFKVYFTKEELEKLGLWDNVLVEMEEG